MVAVVTSRTKKDDGYTSKGSQVGAKGRGAGVVYTLVRPVCLYECVDLQLLIAFLQGREKKRRKRGTKVKEIDR